MSEDKVKYIKCDCCSECSVLKVTESPLYDYMNKKVDYMIHVCIYKCRQNKFPLSHKLRVIWNIIRYGEPYDDDIIVSRDDCKGLIKFLKDIENDYK